MSTDIAVLTSDGGELRITDFDGGELGPSLRVTIIHFARGKALAFDLDRVAVAGTQEVLKDWLLKHTPLRLEGGDHSGPDPIR